MDGDRVDYLDDLGFRAYGGFRGRRTAPRRARDEARLIPRQGFCTASSRLSVPVPRPARPTPPGGASGRRGREAPSTRRCPKSRGWGASPRPIPRAPVTPWDRSWARGGRSGAEGPAGPWASPAGRRSSRSAAAARRAGPRRT
ncbi:hypothetical protein ACFUV1_26075 [Streptomyces griseoincarnatus]